MHATQLVSDVLEHICEWADPASLSVMARTAGVLHEPAIHALWRELPSLIPLLQCFPADSWAIEGDTFKFTRVLRPKDWTAVLKYAFLVRHFDDGQNCFRFPSRPADAAVWESMCCLRPTITLFPQLRTLCWEVIQLPDKCLPSFLVCVGPNPFRMVFESLEHRSGFITDDFRSSLDIMAERFPGLRELHVHVGRCREGGDRTSKPVLLFPTLAPGSFPSLVSFESRICPITPTALLSLVRLKTLRSVAVRLQDDAEWPPAPNTQISLVLQSVHLISSLRTCVAFCKVTTLPHATALNLQLTGVPPSHLIPNLFHAIRRQCSPDVLEIVCIFETGHTREGLIFPAYIRPLLDFKKLEYLEVVFRCEYALDDEFCSDMAKTWPLIKNLEIGNLGTKGVHHVLPTARVLPLFAMHCPQLETLRLAFDARRWENQTDFGADSSNVEIYGALAERASTSVLSVLLVDDSPVLGHEYVAAFLDRVFPNLVHINSGRGVESQWDAVQRFLPLFKHVRKDERRRVTQELSVTGAGGLPEMRR